MPKFGFNNALILVTEWDEFKGLDMRRISSSMEQPILIDGRNIYDPDEMIEAGFLYEGIGRGCREHSKETTVNQETHPVLSGTMGSRKQTE